MSFYVEGGKKFCPQVAKRRCRNIGNVNQMTQCSSWNWQFGWACCVMGYNVKLPNPFWTLAGPGCAKKPSETWFPKVLVSETPPVTCKRVAVSKQNCCSFTENQLWMNDSLENPVDRSLVHTGLTQIKDSWELRHPESKTINYLVVEFCFFKNFFSFIHLSWRHVLEVH